MITDVNMPEMDGFKLAEQIRNDVSLNDVPIIMLTSGTRIGDVADRERLKVDVSLSKPAKQSELFNAIVRVLGVNTPEDSALVSNGVSITCPALTILGSMLFLNTKTPYQNAFKLERMSERNDLDGCEAVFGILRRELATITEELNQFLDESS